MAWRGEEACVSQEVQRFAVKQIKEKTTAVSANQESGLFYSGRQNLSTLSFSSLSLFQFHAPILIQCNAGRKEHLYRSQPERFARQQNRRDVCFLARFKYGFLNNYKTD